MAKSYSRKSKKNKGVDQADGHVSKYHERALPIGTEKDVMTLQRAAGNRAVGRLLQSETEIAVSQPGDATEREASRVADDAVRKPRPVTLLPGSRSKLSEKASGQKSAPVPGSGGQPLSESDRTFFESRLGHNLSNARIHTDSHTAEQAEALNARAFTVGQDIGFGAGQYAPHTAEGKRLLAHELTHVVQHQNLSTGGATEAANAATVMRAPKRRDFKLRAPKLGEARHPIEPPSLLGSEIPKPIVTRVGGGIRATVYFGQDSYFLDSTNYKAVEKLSEELRFMFKPTVIVDGHASAEGAESYNLELSEKRRQLVIALLGVEAIGKAYGESTPAVEVTATTPAALEEQRAANRRVEIFIAPPLKPKKPIDLRPKPKFEPETPEERLERILKEPRPTLKKRRKRSLKGIAEEKFDEFVEGILRKAGVKPEWREPIKNGARSLLELGAETLLDEALDQTDLSDEEKRMIKKSIEAGAETEF